MLEVPEHRTGEDLTDRVGLEQETGDYAEVAAATAQAPEQVGMAGRTGRHQPAVGEDDVRLEQVVDGQAVLARQVPHAATEGESGDTGRRDDAEGYGETVGMGGVVDVAGGAAGGDAHGAVLDVHADPAHPGQVDHQPVVHAAEPRPVVASAADRDFQAGLPRMADTGDHVGCVQALRDEQRPLVDHPVVERPGLVVRRVVAVDDPSAEALSQVSDGVHRHDDSL